MKYFNIHNFPISYISIENTALVFNTTIMTTLTSWKSKACICVKA